MTTTTTDYSTKVTFIGDILEVRFVDIFPRPTRVYRARWTRGASTIEVDRVSSGPEYEPAGLIDATPYRFTLPGLREAVADNGICAG